MTRTLTDSLKVVAAVAVVGIHATSPSEYRFAAHHDFLSLDFFSVLVNQWARYCVPLFIYLSAYGLTKSDKSVGIPFATNYAQFLKKRLPTILVPYFFFSFLSLALQFQSQRGQGGQYHNVWEFVTQASPKLLTGTADYHLYFLVILAQCYFLFPLFLAVARNSPRAFSIISWVALVLVGSTLYEWGDKVLALVGLPQPAWHASFAVYWLPYFLLGIVHGLEKAKDATNYAKNPGVKRRQLRNSIAMVVILILTCAAVVANYAIDSYKNLPPGYYNHFGRPTVLLYTLAVVYWARSLAVQSPSMGFDRIASLAPLTFCVYLVHPQILRAVEYLLPNAATAAVWGIVVTTTFCLVWLLKKSADHIAIKSPLIARGMERCLGLR